MACEICIVDSSVELLWTCIGCSRNFHPACVGLTVQRGSLRKKDKKVIDPSSYVLPCCSTCQHLVTTSFGFNALVEQQSKLVDQINDNTQVVHRSSSQNNVGIINDAMERLEISLADIKIQLTTARSAGLVDNGSSIKNHITSLCDMAMQSSKENISSISTDVRKMHNEIKQLHQLSLQIAAKCSTNSNPVLELDILNELKSLSANIADACINVPSPLPCDACPSSEPEINVIPPAPSFDAGPSPSPFSPDASPSSPPSSSSSPSACPNLQNHSGWRILGRKKIWRADWTKRDARELLAKFVRRRHHHNQHNNNNKDNCNSFRSNFLPPDRVLLAAAKDHFSRPPTNFQPTIRFQRGETLNPYPARDHAAHQRMQVPPTPFNQHCRSCCCERPCFPST